MIPKITPKLFTAYKAAKKIQPKETVYISTKSGHDYIDGRTINDIPRYSFADMLDRFIFWLGNSKR